MAEPMSDLQFQSLEIRMKRAERWLKVVLCLFTLFLVSFSEFAISTEINSCGSPGNASRAGANRCGCCGQRANRDSRTHSRSHCGWKSGRAQGSSLRRHTVQRP